MYQVGDMVKTVGNKPCGLTGSMYEGRVAGIGSNHVIVKHMCGQAQGMSRYLLTPYSPTQVLPVTCGGCCCCTNRICEVTDDNRA
jgi:hypothetical protein